VYCTPGKALPIVINKGKLDFFEGERPLLHQEIGKIKTTLAITPK
jgi:hypothetical protein